MKSADSAVILYERKFKDMNAQIEEQKQIVKADNEKNDKLEVKNRQLNQEK